MGIEQFLAQRFTNEGFATGIEKKSIDVVKNLLTQTDFTVQKIAGIAEVTVAFVEAVKANMGQSAN